MHWCVTHDKMLYFHFPSPWKTLTDKWPKYHPSIIRLVTAPSRVISSYELSDLPYQSLAVCLRRAALSCDPTTCWLFILSLLSASRNKFVEARLSFAMTPYHAQHDAESPSSPLFLVSDEMSCLQLTGLCQQWKYIHPVWKVEFPYFYMVNISTLSRLERGISRT